jgi:hypothetical protein
LSEIINNDNPLLDFPFFAENFLKIRSKSGEIKPLKLNRAQLYVHGLLEKEERKMETKPQADL